jgi:hypothetical protein
VGTCPFTAYSGEGDQGSGVMPISVPVDSDQVIGAERRWQGDCGGIDRNRQEDLDASPDFSTTVPAFRSPLILIGFSPES